MVSLENRADYSFRINESPKLTAFNNLLLNRTTILTQNLDLNESDEIYLGLIQSILATEKTTFIYFYNKKNKSHPSKESPSPFVNDDFLIFCLIVGIEKFSLEKNWIKNIVSIRVRNGITITFENILNENYYSKDNLSEIVLMYFQLINPSLITNDLLNEAYIGLSKNTELFEGKSDFQILCALRAYDLIILLKESPSGSEINLLKKFNLAFLKRVKLLSWLVQTAILAALMYGAIELISYNPSIKTFFDKFGTVLKIFGIFGLSQIGNAFPVFKRKSYDSLLRIFGYPAELIVEFHKKESK